MMYKFKSLLIIRVSRVIEMALVLLIFYLAQKASNWLLFAIYWLPLVVAGILESFVPKDYGLTYNTAKKSVFFEQMDPRLECFIVNAVGILLMILVDCCS